MLVILTSPSSLQQVCALTIDTVSSLSQAQRKRSTSNEHLGLVVSPGHERYMHKLLELVLLTPQATLCPRFTLLKFRLRHMLPLHRIEPRTETFLQQPQRRRGPSNNTMKPLIVAVETRDESDLSASEPPTTAISAKVWQGLEALHWLFTTVISSNFARAHRPRSSISKQDMPASTTFSAGRV